MPGADLSFDRGDLAAAALDSRGHLPAFLGDLIEAAAIAVERGLLIGQGLPAQPRIFLKGC
jgi:hypothetical protein